MMAPTLQTLLDAARAIGGGTLLVNLSCDDPLALTGCALAKEQGSALAAAIAAAAEAMQAGEICLMRPASLDFSVPNAKTVEADRSLVLREVPAAVHMMRTGELRACPDERHSAIEGPDGPEGKPLVMATAEELLYEEGVRYLTYQAGDTRKLLKVSLGTTVQSLLSEQGATDKKAILLGGLEGRLVTPDCNDAIDASPDFDLIRVYDSHNCLADVTASLFALAREESCQKCVLCREGTWHLAGFFEDITTGKANRETLPMVEDISPIIQAGAFCSFGRGMARLAMSAVAVGKDEFNLHILRKQCPCGVCAAFNRKTYVIDPKKCSANGDCVDACDEDAITFKKNFISMIDKAMCTGCGKCVDACEEGAIVVNDGSIRTPTKATRVGRFK